MSRDEARVQRQCYVFENQSHFRGGVGQGLTV